MNIIIPMAGRGQRFADVGWKVPKPLIPIDGEPMYSWATRGIPLWPGVSLTFVVRNDEYLHDLKRDIEKRYEAFAPNIVVANAPTEGQACSVLLAERYISEDAPLLIHNADTFFASNLAVLTAKDHNEYDGLITVFRATGSRWSYAKIEADGTISRVVEKDPISPWGTTGTYLFSRGGDFISAAKEMIVRNERVNGEFYIAPIYNRLIENGARILPDYAKRVGCMGTPEDLAQFHKEFGISVHHVH